MKKIDIKAALDLIIAADAVAIDGTPAAISHYIGDDDMSEWEDNPAGFSGSIVDFSYSGFDHLNEATLCANHTIQIPTDGSGMVVLEENGQTAFSIELFESKKISLFEPEPEPEPEKEDPSVKGQAYNVKMATLANVSGSVRVIGDGEKTVEELAIEEVDDGGIEWGYSGTTDDLPEICGIEAVKSNVY